MWVFVFEGERFGRVSVSVSFVKFGELFVGFESCVMFCR